MDRDDDINLPLRAAFKQYTPTQSKPSGLDDGPRELYKQRGLHAHNAKGHRVSIPVQDWFKTCIPPGAHWFDGEATRVMNALNHNGERIYDGVWVPLKTAMLQEDQVCETLGTIANAVASHSKSEATTIFVTHPMTSPRNAAKPKHDGRHILRVIMPLNHVEQSHRRRSEELKKTFWGAAEPAMWPTASLVEAKPSDREKAKNNRQMVGGAAHLLYNDPARRYVYGITIEETIIILWRFDRGLVVRSQPFDCNENPEQLVRMLLFLGTATRTQLGFDPTVQRMSESGEPNSFIYDLGKDGFYRTVGHPISEDGAYFLISRGVRVWSVKKCDFEGNFISDEENVLKDLWVVNTSLKSEAEIQTAICGKLEPEDAASLKKRLLTIVHDECVSIDGQLDETIAKPPQAIVEALSTSAANLGPKTRQSTTPMISSHDLGKGSNHSRGLQHYRRVHRRTLVKEKCITFYKVDNLKEAVVVMKDFVEALQLFMKAGWLHRDISGGNCLVYYDGGKPCGKIADLEFCKEYDQISVDDPVIGTFEFMAGEVLAEKFLFTPWWKRCIQYHYHFYHDLEATFWLFVWFILTHVPEDCDVLPGTERIWEETFGHIFGANSSGFSKSIYLEQPLNLLEPFQGWGWSNDAPLGRLMQSLVINVSRSIFDAHQRLQLQDPQPVEPSSPFLRWPKSQFENSLYQGFSQALQEMLDGLVTNCSVVAIQQEIKRPLDGEENEGESSKRAKPSV